MLTWSPEAELRRRGIVRISINTDRSCNKSIEKEIADITHQWHLKYLACTTSSKWAAKPFDFVKGNNGALGVINQGMFAPDTTGAYNT
jgi:hypothetical protein